MNPFFFCCTLLFPLLISPSVSAQKVWKACSKYDGDLKVYIVDSKQDADLIVYKVDSKQDADENGCWFFVKSKYDADKKVYFVTSKDDADLHIFYTKSKNNAGWRTSKKKHLMK